MTRTHQINHMGIFVLAAMMLGLAATVVRADESRIPLHAPAVTSTTVVINAPGSYFLTRNFTSSAPAAISIESDNVSLDLNGRTVTKTGTGSVINSGAFTNIAITNGTLTGGQSGVTSTGAAPSVVNIRLTDLNIYNATGYSVYLLTANAFIQSCRFHNSNTGGQALAGVFIQGKAHFVGNTVTATQASGVYLSSNNGSEFRENIISDFNLSGTSNSGLYVYSSNTKGGIIIKDNTFTNGDNGSGIRLNDSSYGNMIAGNTVRGATYGMYVESDGNQIVGNNLVTGTYGVYLNNADRNLIDNNLAQGYNYGIYFTGGASGNAYRNNMLVGNNGAAVSDPQAQNIDAGGNIQ